MAIVVPVRNGATMVEACVAACRAQTRPPDEVIVVDNGSTDGTASAASAAGATVLFEPKRGSFMARNRGWKGSASEIIAFTDVDCVPDPTWLAELTEPFREPAVAGVGGDIVQAEHNSASQRWIVERRFLDQQFNADHVFLPFFATANVAYRRSVLVELDGFDEIFGHTAGDNDMSWRVQALAGGRLVYQPSARVLHHVGERVTEVTTRWRRYSAGIYVLERRWSGWPGFPETPGFWARTKRVWELPFALALRAASRRPLSIAALDAAVALSSEIGRLQGRLDARTTGVTPLRDQSR